MNKTIAVIKNRVSWRSYSSRKVALSKLNEIVEAGKMAPSACNRQIANILVLRSKRNVAKLKKLSQEVRGTDCYYGANTLVLVYGPRDNDFTVQDCSCILENMFIAATALNIQSCWINQSDEFLSTRNGLKVKKALGIPEDARVVGTCILGYANESANLEIKPRKTDFITIK